jgi:glycosyltransferase involved in cell wall biosynthesis
VRILHIAQADNLERGGGGLIALFRLHHALKKSGIDSKILCKTKRPEFADSTAMPSSYFLRKVESFIGRVTSRLGLNDIHCISAFGVKNHKAYLNADILNLHCIHGGFFSYLALPTLTANKPTVFTLHDMWPFTGHCTVSYDCDRWKIGCGDCPYPNAPNAVRRDSTRLEWRLKNRIYSRSKLVVVALSHCRTEQARESMLGQFPIHQIPNGIDTEVFRPLDSQQCRSLLGIPTNKRVLMFAAPKLDAFNKGGDLFVKAFQALPNSLKKEIAVILLGSRAERLTEALGTTSTYDLGYVTSEYFKVIAYGAADIFVSPTRAESLPLVMQESMACGTPMVSFNVGGVPDIVRHGITGYLAEAENANDLSKGIVQLLDNPQLRKQMADNCREIALREYTVGLQVDRYIDLYTSLLQNGSVKSQSVHPLENA